MAERQQLRLRPLCTASELVKRLSHCVGADAELLVEHGARGRRAKGVHADADAILAHILLPAECGSRLE